MKRLMSHPILSFALFIGAAVASPFVSLPVEKWLERNGMDDGSWIYVVTGFLASVRNTVWFPYVAGFIVSMPLWRFFGNQLLREEVRALKGSRSVARPDARSTKHPVVLAELEAVWADKIGDLAGYSRSDRDDFDLVAVPPIITATRTQDGFDLRPVVYYRNRSPLPLPITPLAAEWRLDGVDVPQAHKGFTTPAPKEETPSVRLSAVRVYDERPRSGAIRLAIAFGQDSKPKAIMVAVYAFKIVGGYPENTSTSGPVQIELDPSVNYWTK